MTDAQSLPLKPPNLKGVLLYFACMVTTASIMWFAWLNPKTHNKPMCRCEREGHACMCSRK